MRFSLRQSLAGVAFIAVVVALFAAFWRVLDKNARAWQIQEGMAKAEVLRIAGEPDRITKTGLWEYDLWPIPGGPLAVRFDDSSDRVYMAENGGMLD